MNKKEFLEMGLKEQIKFLNTELNNKKSIREITRGIGIPRTTLRDMLARNNYFYSKKHNEYIIKNNQKEDMELIAQRRKEPSISSNLKVEPKKESKVTKEIISIPNTITTTNPSKKDNKYTMFSRQEIKELKELLQYKKEIIEMCTLKSNKNITQNTIIGEEYTGDFIVKTFKIQKDILESFNQFCKKNSHIKQQNIITFVLQEFLKNYT